MKPIIYCILFLTLITTASADLKVQVISPKPGDQSVSEWSIAFPGFDAKNDTVDPYSVTCNGLVPGGSSKWLQDTWTFYFAETLPAGTSCKAVVSNAFLKIINGAISDKELTLAMSTLPTTCQVQGPSMVSIVPNSTGVGNTNGDDAEGSDEGAGENANEGDSADSGASDDDSASESGAAAGESPTIIKENEFFALTFDCPVTEASIEKEVSISIEGLGDRIPVKLITGAARENALQEKKLTSEANLYVLQATRPLPPRANVTLQIGKIVAKAPAKNGTNISQEDTELGYRVRPRFEVTMQCEHSFANGSCDPFLPIYAVFSTKPASYYDENYNNISLKGPLAGQQWEGEIVESFPTDDGQYGTALKFKPPFAANKSFTFAIPDSFKDSEGRTYVGNQALTVKTGGIPPMVRFNGTFGVLEKDTGTGLPITVRSVEQNILVAPQAGTEKPDEDLKIQALKVTDASQIMGWLSKVQHHYDTEAVKAGSKALLSSSSPDIKQQVIKRPHSKDAFEVLGIPFTDPGFYVVEATSKQYSEIEATNANPATQVTSVLVTDLGVHAKLYSNKALVWVTSLKTGDSVPQANVSVHDCHGRVRGTGVTAADGVAELELSPPGKNDNNESCDLGYFASDVAPGMPSVDLGTEPLLVQASKDTDTSFVLSSWSKGLESWRFGIGSSYYEPSVDTKKSSPAFVAKTVLARNLLRIGETVHFKHIIREKTKDGLVLVREKPSKLVMTIRHNGSGDEIELPATFENGSVALNEWKIPESAKLGDYSVSLNMTQAASKTTLYTGSFSVLNYKVPPMKGSISRVADASLSNMNVDTSVSYLAGGAAVGQPVLLRYRYEPFDGNVSDQYADYTFSNQLPPETEEVNHEPEMPGAYLGVRTQTKTLDTSGGARFDLNDLEKFSKVAFVRTELEYRDDNGETQTVSQRFLKLPEGLMLGVRKNSWLSKEGHFVFDVLALDSDGKPVSSKTISGKLLDKKLFGFRKRLVGGFYSFEEAQDLQSYGEVCNGQTNEQGIFHCEINVAQAGAYQLEVSSGNTTLQTNMSSTDGEAWTEQDNSDRFDLVAEKEKYEPGENATLQVRLPFMTSNVLFTFEKDGILRHTVQTVVRSQATVSLPVTVADVPNVFVSAVAVRGRLDEATPTSMFDPGRPALRVGYTELQVGRKPLTLVVNVTPDKKQYKTREPVNVAIEVPKAANGEVAVAVVDEGLLELKKNTSWDLLDNMIEKTYSPGVQTVTNQLLVIGKRHFGLKGLPFGGGGGQRIARELFDTLVYWNPSVALDAQGKANVHFTLNDSITSFRIAAIATSGNALFGTGFASIAASKDIILEPAIPLVVREQDELQVEASLRNTTTDKHAVTAAVAIEGKDLPTKQVSLDATTPSSKVAWAYTVPKAVSSLSIKFQALEGTPPQAVDAVNKKIAVLPKVPVQVINSRLLETQDLSPGMPYTVNLDIPKDAVNTNGGVQIAVSNSYQAPDAVIQDYMKTYPYSCLEQQISKATTLDSNEMWQSIVTNLGGYIDNRGFAKFFRFSYSGDVALTTYVLETAKAAGKEIDATQQDKLVQALQKQVKGAYSLFARGAKSTQQQFAERWQILAALSYIGKPETTIADALLQVNAATDTGVLVDMLMAAAYDPALNQGKGKKVASTSMILDELQKRTAIRGAGVALQVTGTDFSIFSAETVQSRLLYILQDVPDLKKSYAAFSSKLAAGLILKLGRSALGNTTADTWGHLAFNGLGTVATGVTELKQGQETSAVTFAKENNTVHTFAWNSGPVTINHTGTGMPLVVVQQRAAVPVTTAVTNGGVAITKTVSKADTHNGDIIEVAVTVDAAQAEHWIVIDDPLVPGSVVLDNSLARNSQIANDTTDSSFPEFVENAAGEVRIYFSYIPQGKTTYRYKVRLNASGLFSLPATTVAAMYAPDITFGATPNASMTVKEAAAK